MAQNIWITNIPLSVIPHAGRGRVIAWYLLFFFLFLKFYWSIVDLQVCDNFCCTIKWFSYIRTHIHPFRFFPHIDCHGILGRVFCAVQQVPFGQSFHMLHCTYTNPKLPVHPSPLNLFSLVTVNFLLVS